MWHCRERSGRSRLPSRALQGPHPCLPGTKKRFRAEPAANWRYPVRIKGLPQPATIKPAAQRNKLETWLEAGRADHGSPTWQPNDLQARLRRVRWAINIGTLSRAIFEKGEWHDDPGQKQNFT